MTITTYYQQQATLQISFEIEQAIEADNKAMYEQEMIDEAKYWARVEAAEFEN